MNNKFNSKLTDYDIWLIKSTIDIMSDGDEFDSNYVKMIIRTVALKKHSLIKSINKRLKQ